MGRGGGGGIQEMFCIPWDNYVLTTMTAMAERNLESMVTNRQTESYIQKYLITEPWTERGSHVCTEEKFGFHSCSSLTLYRTLLFFRPFGNMGDRREGGLKDNQYQESILGDLWVDNQGGKGPRVHDDSQGILSKVKRNYQVGRDDSLGPKLPARRKHFDVQCEFSLHHSYHSHHHHDLE